ncbi:MAG: RNA polymerase sigma factor SigF [Pseudanabaena sp.]|jgi:RNA polymerase sigma-B factor|nr:RNA polymerase sigma factor SigF [Pseudanabaena sp. M53BS1SP1A06MG]MCA6583016.1 RNA polymerase sigma factor SigF [Pseudanabaena sp. M34BS1SP1A06MG]MCA6588598.1 RNA polymerase sigma factor SigF [Pseudanabaena sp. M109S1SP1A06QC]MCA6591697.1 RNA polymerase sigma factor SigF [Pseudanabaena sp. M38BS1SP1A06MG]MCA6602829.1 RNA polymerase sigma factor SigF [Pseudanabaena sp. M57BS1SP1A06MG]MCA6605981.1 RNA polymerase sigma factor SigF [Pseudanabaena sp. M007S1SP1A06QC]MCA6611196.1 RNA polymerase
MPLDSNSSKNENILPLLRAYRVSSSENLQEQIVEIYMGLIRETIATLPISLINQTRIGNQRSRDRPVTSERRVSNRRTAERRLSDRELLEIGKLGFKKALSQFNLEKDIDFSEFARSQIYQHLVNFLQSQNLDSRNEPQNEREIDITPTATRKQETLEILQDYRMNPTTELRNQLVNLNIGLVRREAYHWKNQCQESFEDLMQVGSIGLINAIERFDVSKGNAFSSFAVPYIKGEIQHYLRDKSPTLRMPRAWLTTYNQGCKFIRNKRTETGHEPSSQEVADELGISVSEWYDIKLACQNRSPISLDTPVEQSEDSSTSIGDLVTDHKYQSFQLAQEDSIRLQQALDLLEDRTREVVEFVFLKEFTHREVAETLGISAITVSRQLKKGITALKKILATPID